MSGSPENKFLYRSINYKEITQSALAFSSVIPAFLLMDQSSGVDIPYDFKLLVVNIYAAIGIGMTYRGVIHLNRALRTS